MYGNGGPFWSGGVFVEWGWAAWSFTTMRYDAVDAQRDAQALLYEHMRNRYA